MKLPNLLKQDSPYEIIQTGYRYALSLCHHHHDAEDLVQQSWVKCYQKYKKVKNKTMLFTVIRNLYFDRLRRNKIVTFEPIEDDNIFLSEQMVGSYGETLDIDFVLANLRSEEREAIYLNFVEGYSAREIGKLTGKPRNTVLSLLYRAKQKLSQVESKVKGAV